ncbi:MAG TPA: alpha/beta hydrolase [Pseudonocardiaceae bacterium]|nr:alpha/beta hydrolase [Pseudonocardiaceae bacterium]
MTGVAHRTVDVHGLPMHVAEAGSGPLVVLLHGFPESWYSWRHQLTALADGGFHAVAPDQRGYGRTGGPADASEYTMLHLVGDVMGLLDALGEPTAAVVGHDWGAPVAWHCALLRPDRVRAVAAMSAPYRPRGGRVPTEAMRAGIGDGFYMLYFQTPGVAEDELDRDPGRTLRMLLYSASGDGPQRPPMVPPGGGFLDMLAEPDELPGWLTEADLAEFTKDYQRTGFTGGLNWYRNLDRNWELTSAWHHAKITTPALFLAGELDLVINGPGTRQYLTRMAEHVPNLRRTVLLPGCGHWTQQERPAEVNAALVEFLRAETQT